MEGYLPPELEYAQQYHEGHIVNQKNGRRNLNNFV